MAYTEPHHLVSSANESAGTSSFSRNMYRDRSRVLDDIDIINSPVESMISPSRKELGIYSYGKLASLVASLPIYICVYMLINLTI